MVAKLFKTSASFSKFQNHWEFNFDCRDGFSNGVRACQAVIVIFIWMCANFSTLTLIFMAPLHVRTLMEGVVAANESCTALNIILPNTLATTDCYLYLQRGAKSPFLLFYILMRLFLLIHLSNTWENTVSVCFITSLKLTKKQVYC